MKDIKLPNMKTMAVDNEKDFNINRGYNAALEDVRKLNMTNEERWFRDFPIKTIDYKNRLVDIRGSTGFIMRQEFGGIDRVEVILRDGSSAVIKIPPSWTREAIDERIERVLAAITTQLS